MMDKDELKKLKAGGWGGCGCWGLGVRREGGFGGAWGGGGVMDKDELKKLKAGGWGGCG